MFALLFLISQFYSDEPAGYFRTPVFTAYGIVVTDDHYSTLYLIRKNTLKKLVEAPGCGRYYTVSGDGRLIGFKLISEDGLQRPAIYDLKQEKTKQLHSPVFCAGQVLFSYNNNIAFTIGEQFFLQQDDGTDSYLIGYYSNLAPISPDCRYVVYNDEDDRLWVLRLSDGKRVCITDHKKGCFAPVWSNGSRYLLYSSLDGFIKVYDVVEQRTFDIDQGYSPAWSFDDKYIIYYKTKTDDHRLTGSDLFLAKFDGTQIIQLTDTPHILEIDPKFYSKEHIIFTVYDRNEIFTARIFQDKLVDIELLYQRKKPLSVNHAAVNPDYGMRDSIDVPYLHQVYDVPDWFDGHWACAPTTAMMAIAYYYKLPYWDCSCSLPYNHTSHYGRYICERYHYYEVDYNWSAQDPSGNWAEGGYGYMWYDTNRPYTHMALYLNNHGLNSWRDGSPTFNETIAELDSGYPYGMCVGLTAAGHLVLAVGQVLTWHTLIFNDPYGNKNTAGYPSYDGKYARYDWPGYNNGYENLNNVYWCVGARGGWEIAADTIVDDLQFNGGFYLHTEEPGSMAFWWDRLTGFQGHTWWTYTTAAAGQDTCYAIWTPHLAVAGDYEVFAYIPSTDGQATGARYRVFYDGDSQTVVINQTNYADQWVSLGVYPFDTTGGYVYLGDATGEQGQHIAFDAVRWSYQGSGVKERAVLKSIRDWIITFDTNPVRDNIILRFKLRTAKKSAFSIYNSAGACVYKEEKRFLNKGNHIIKINVSTFSAGVYFIKVKLDSRNTIRKIVIL